MVRSSLQQRQQVIEAAQATLNELGIDPTEPVDVFSAIERLDLDLTFLPLDNLLGAVMPTGRGGVIVTTERPPTVQRYTAAHEVGHWVLDADRLALDGELEVNGSSPQLREQNAQLFASYFLMPAPLVRRVAADHGVPPGVVPGPEQVYLIARDLYTSYEATSRHLRNLGYITSLVLKELMAIAPLTAKRQVGRGRRPIDGHADVWTLDAEAVEAHPNVNVRINDEVTIALPENRTTGYTWLLAGEESDRLEAESRPEPDSFATSTDRQDLRTRRPRISDPTSAVAIREALRRVPTDAPMIEGAAPEFDGPVSVVDSRYFPGWFGRSAVARMDKHRQSIAAAAQTRLAQDESRPAISATGLRLISFRPNIEGRWRILLYLRGPSSQPLLRL